MYQSWSEIEAIYAVAAVSPLARVSSRMFRGPRCPAVAMFKWVSFYLELSAQAAPPVRLIRPSTPRPQTPRPTRHPHGDPNRGCALLRAPPRPLVLCFAAAAAPTRQRGRSNHKLPLSVV